MTNLKKRIETEADLMSIGYNTNSNEIFIELKSEGTLADKTSYMYMSIEEAKGVIGYLERAIEDLKEELQ